MDCGFQKKETTDSPNTRSKGIPSPGPQPPHQGHQPPHNNSKAARTAKIQANRKVSQPNCLPNCPSSGGRKPSSEDQRKAQPTGHHHHTTKGQGFNLDPEGIPSTPAGAESCGQNLKGHPGQISPLSPLGSHSKAGEHHHCREMPLCSKTTYPINTSDLQWHCTLQGGSGHLGHFSNKNILPRAKEMHKLSEVWAPCKTMQQPHSLRNLQRETPDTAVPGPPEGWQTDPGKMPQLQGNTPCLEQGVPSKEGTHSPVARGQATPNHPNINTGTSCNNITSSTPKGTQGESMETENSSPSLYSPIPRFLGTPIPCPSPSSTKTSTKTPTKTLNKSDSSKGGNHYIKKTRISLSPVRFCLDGRRPSGCKPGQGEGLSSGRGSNLQHTEHTHIHTTNSQHTYTHTHHTHTHTHHTHSTNTHTLHTNTHTLNTHTHITHNKNTYQTTKQHHTHKNSSKNHPKDKEPPSRPPTPCPGGGSNVCSRNGPGQLPITTPVQPQGPQAHQSHGRPPHSRGDGIKILQWNINGANTKLAALQAAVKQDDTDIILLQETLIQNQKFNLNGYISYIKPKLNGRGLATLIKKSIPSEKIINPIYCGEEVETLATKIHLQNQTFTLYNIYKSPRHTLDLTEVFEMGVHENILIAGDFNAHHPILNSITDTNWDGHHINTLLDEIPEMYLANSGEPTHIRGGRLDLVFLPTYLRDQTSWLVHPTLTSDHFATLTTINIQKLPNLPPPPPGWNFNKADWEKFQKAIQNWKNAYQPPADINQLERDLTEAIQQAADEAIPKINTKHNNKDHWFYCDSQRTQKQIKQSQKSPKKTPYQ